MLISHNRSRSFGEFAAHFGVDADALYRALCEFEANDGHGLLGKRQLQKLKKEGITLQRGRTRDFLKKFADSPQSRGFNLSPDAIDAFLEDLGEHSRHPGNNVIGALLGDDRDVLRTFSSLFAFRNTDLESARSDYAGYYYLVRRTSREGAEYYYEEPFRLADLGHQSFMIPHKQDAQLGFSFASMGACTTVLLHRHRERTIGVSVVMLYGQSNPERNAMSGVLLRFSDDTARPSACQVLARRVQDENVFLEWQSSMDDISKRMAERPDDRETRDAVRTASRFANRIDESSGNDALFDIYRAFGLGFMAKALDQKQWDEALEKATQIDEDLARRFQG